MKPIYLLLLILLLAFGLRVYRLDSQALRGDEAATVLYAAMPVSELWELSRVTDPHPPLYYLLLHPWQWLLGEAAWPMRFAGVIASTLAVAALYSLVQRTLRRVNLSLLVGFLLAVNPLQIWLAQDIRAYALFTLLGLLSSMALWAWLTNKQECKSSTFACQNKILTLLYIVLTTACLYTHYYTIFLIAFQGLFVLINLRRFWDKRWGWLGSQIAIGLLVTPGLSLAYNFMGQAAGGIETIPTREILRLASTALLTGFTVDTWWSWLSLLLTPVWLIGLLTLLRHDFTRATFWGLFGMLPILGVIAMSIGRPFFKERFLVQAQPAFELWLAVGFQTIWILKPHRFKKPVRFAQAMIFLCLLLINAVALNNYFTNPAYAKSIPWQLYHQYVHKNARAGDVMLTNFPEASVSYYSPNELPFYVVPEERDKPLAYRLTRTADIAQAYTRIWFIPLPHQGFDPQNEVLTWLDRHADRVNQVFFPSYNLNLYLSPPTIEALMIKSTALFEQGIKLRGYQIFDKYGKSRLTATAAETYTLTTKAGKTLTLSLYWQATNPTAVPYTAFVHLLSAEGINRVGQDNLPVWGSYPTTAWQAGEKITDKYTLTIPKNTPPGDHHLQIGWYHSDTLARLSVILRSKSKMPEYPVGQTASLSRPWGQTSSLSYGYKPLDSFTWNGVGSTGQTIDDHVRLNVIIRIE